MATQSAPLSKDQQQALAKIKQARDGVQDQLNNFTNDAKAKAELVKKLAAMDDKAEELKGKGPKAIKELLALVKQMQDLEKAVRAAMEAAMLAVMRRDFTATSNAQLAEAMLLVGQLADPALIKLIAPQQLALRAKVDKIEGMKDNKQAVFAINDLDVALEELVLRCKKAATLSSWLKGSYQPLVARVEAAIKALPHERVRRVLQVEIDFIDGDRNKVLAKLDAAAMKSLAVAPLQALEKQATRMSAVWTALDREMIRVGGLLKDAGSPPDLAAWLKALAQEKAEGWSKAGTAELLDKTVEAFEKDLGELAQTAKRAAQKAKA